MAEIPHKNPGWLDLFTEEVLVIRDTITRIEYDPASPIREGDWAVYVPVWHTQLHPGDECDGAMAFAEHAPGIHNIYGGPVVKDDDGTLYVNVSLPMTIETSEPLKTDTYASVLGSTYQLCWARNPLNAATLANATATTRRRKLQQGWTPTDDGFVLTTDVIDVVDT